jgi:hypothetical protein
MTPQTSTPRAVADRARQVIAKVRPGSTEGHRSLPIRSSPEQIQARWDEPASRAAILKDIPVDDASLTVGDPDRDWGRTVTLDLRLSAAVPDMGTQALTGKALRRLKAVCETGEIPTTAFNPSGRDDAGGPS